MNERISSATLIILPYSILISSLYLFAYWDSFDVDFYSYITPSEIAVWSILPLVSVGILSIVGIMLGAGGSQNSDKKERSQTLKTLFILFNIIMIIGFSCAIYFNYYRWIAISSVLPLFLISVIKYSQIIENGTLRKHLLPIFILIYLPCISFGFGKYNAAKISDFSNYKAIITNNSCFNEIYLGKLDQFIFSYNLLTRSTSIQKINDTSRIMLRQSSKNDLTKNRCGTATLPHN